MSSKKNIDIFVASPSDVQNERMIVKEVCEAYNRAIGKEIEIKAHLYEDYPLDFNINAQDGINRYKLPSECDIVIVILWTRMGTILDGFEGEVTKNKKVTGTWWEVEHALAHNQPVYLYRKTVKKKFTEEEIAEAQKQKELREDFFKGVHFVTGTASRGNHKFKTISEFKQKIITHLGVEIERITQKKVILNKGFKNKKSFLLLSLLFLTLPIFSFFLYSNFYQSSELSKTTESYNLSVKELKIADQYIYIRLNLKALHPTRGLGVALVAKKNVKRYEKFFESGEFLAPQNLKLIDENGVKYRFISSTLNPLRSSNDWVMLQPHEEMLIEFTFHKNQKIVMGKEFDFITLFKFSFIDKQGEQVTTERSIDFDSLVSK